MVKKKKMNRMLQMNIFHMDKFSIKNKIIVVKNKLMKFRKKRNVTNRILLN
jgi:hypothetical protein